MYIFCEYCQRFARSLLIAVQSSYQYRQKKEYIVNLYRAGKLYTTEAREVLDHDFPDLADAVIIPHGIYDMQRNEGFINLGNSRDTTEFACDSLRQWWQ